MKKFCATLALSIGSTLALAATLDTHGTAPKPAAPVAPATDCANVVLLSASVNYSDNSIDKYRFGGTCNINISPAGKPAKMANVPVTIEAEWSPKMKRASEMITINAGSSHEPISSWATCDVDPFIMKSAKCSGQGVGSKNFSMFLRVSDAPFTKGRASKYEAELRARQAQEVANLKLECPAGWSMVPGSKQDRTFTCQPQIKFQLVEGANMVTNEGNMIVVSFGRPKLECPLGTQVFQGQKADGQPLFGCQKKF